jgi:predicted RNA-binding Zn ribbon-like protein
MIVPAGAGAIQPGGRAPAPGELAVVQAFVNTHFSLADDDWGEDRLATPEGLQRWLAERGRAGTRGVTPTREDLGRAVAVREGLRALAATNGRTPTSRLVALAALNEAAEGAAVEIRLTEAGPRFVAHAGSPLDEALGRVLAVTAMGMVDGTWARLKICPGDHCGWAFYDHSRNASGRWCSMSVCGGRAKARAHYRRQQVAVAERRD